MIINKACNFLKKVENRLKNIFFYKKLKLYNSMMDKKHPFKNFPQKMIGNCSANPHEFFSHYDAYSLWLYRKITLKNGGGKLILDVGNRKVTNAILSVTNKVTALVLMDCEDKLSNINYIIHDIAKPLPFEDNSYDVFTSLASLHLVGMSRYGDELNPNTLFNFIGELDRVLKDNSELIFSITYGKNCLTFNNGWIFDLDTLKMLFKPWELVDFLLDNNSSPNIKEYNERFTKNLSLENWQEGEYRTIFLHFKRNKI
jgi:SAM-dependent methyltransferase